jgi:transcriptional regulator with XRE-family HTH domain
LKASLSKAGRPGLRNLVGDRIREHRKAFGWTQKMFSKLLKEHKLTVSRSSLVKIEAGNRYVLDYELVAIAAVLGLRAEELLPDDIERVLGKLGYK